MFRDVQFLGDGFDLFLGEDRLLLLVLQLLFKFFVQVAKGGRLTLRVEVSEVKEVIVEIEWVAISLGFIFGAGFKILKPSTGTDAETINNDRTSKVKVVYFLTPFLWNESP